MFYISLPSLFFLHVIITILCITANVYVLLYVQETIQGQKKVPVSLKQVLKEVQLHRH